MSQRRQRSCSVDAHNFDIASEAIFRNERCFPLSYPRPASYMTSENQVGFMDDRLTKTLVKLRDDLISALDMMRRGVLTTHHNGSDTTKETVAQYIGWVGDLTAAIEGREIDRERDSGS